MTTKLADLDEFFSPGLVLTVRGKEYTVPLASAELGMWCRRIAVGAGQLKAASTKAEIAAAIESMQSLPDLGDDLSFEQRLLGPVYDDLVADRVEDVYVQFCARTAFIWVISGEENAATWWQAGGLGEGHRPANNRAERRAATPKPGGTSGAAAKKTRTPASTSGTRSPAKKSPAARKR